MAMRPAPDPHSRCSGNNNIATREQVAMEKTCICRDEVACKGLTSAFSMLEDARGGFVRLPRHVENPSSQYYVERNAQRAAYLKYLLPDHPVEQETHANHVAMHHFHAKIVADLTPQRRFPKTLSKEDMDKLGMHKCQEDEVLDEQGLPTGFYFFVPTYPIAMAKNDVKRLLGICKVINTEEEMKKTKHYQFAELTNLSSSTDGASGSPTPGAAFLDSDSDEENAVSMGKFLPWYLKQVVMPPLPPKLSTSVDSKNEGLHQPTPLTHSFAEF